MAKTFYIIDGHAQIFRSYYAPFQPLTSPNGEPTKATYVFCASLFNLLREHRPDYLAMAIDVGDSAVFRRDIYPEYKANREPTPEDLIPQADRIIEIVRAMGIPVLSKPGYEADDLMATLVRRFAGADLNIFLVSKDKDLEQLLSERVSLLDLGKDEIIDPERLREKKGYAPEQAVEIQTLTGDNVDNIPGVPGIGPKTAAKLIAKYGDAANVLAHADELTPKQKENVKAFAAQMPVTRQLVTLHQEVGFDFDIEAARFAGLPVENVKPIFESLGFNRLLEQLESFRAGDAPNASDARSPIRAPGASPGTTPHNMSTRSAHVTEEESKEELASPAEEHAARYELVDTEDKLIAMVKSLGGVKAFAVDTETTSLNPVAAKLVGIAVCWEPGVAYYIPVRAAMGSVVPLSVVREHLGPILRDPVIAKIGQNIKYDLVVFKQAGIELSGVSFDTMIASFVLEPLRRSHGMDALALDLLGHKTIPISALIGKGKAQIGIDEVDTAQVCEYAAEDAEVTWRLGEVLGEQLRASPTRKLFEETEMPLVEVLAEMEHNGVSLDAPLLRKMSDELADRIVELSREVQRAAGHDFNVDSPKQLANVLFDEQNLPIVRKTKTGRSTDADTLEALAAQTDHPVPRLMLEYRELSKLKSTYLDTLPKMVCARTGRIHTSFHPTGAVTGRLSSSNPNLQNIPVRTEAGRRIRSAFVTGDPENVLLVADYSQIELRILAHFSRDEALLAAFRGGQDIHSAVAAQVNGVEPSEVTPEQRSAAKAVNFGIIYGQTAFGLARSLGISRNQAQTFIDRYHARYPGIKAFVEQCVTRTREQGYAETILGRRRPIDQLLSRNRQQIALGERLAVNTIVQGSAADLIKRAMIDIHQEINSRKLATKMLIQVHDELVFEVRRAEVEGQREMIREKMTQAIPLDVPIVVDIGVGENWLAAK